jgi:hypothetical protein
MTERLIEIADPNDTEEMSSVLSNLSNINTLYLTNSYDENGLIEEFGNRWTNEISVEILDILTSNQGVSPSKYILNSDGDQNDLIYGETTSQDISRPYFEYNSVSINNIKYSDEEEKALEDIYSKQSISDSIEQKISEMSSQIFSKMNFNTEDNFSFQKAKTKAIKFKNTSIFEEAPEVIETTSPPATTSIATSGIY